MANEKRIVFDPFWLDLTNECVWKGSESLSLRPKAFAVLHYLLGRPGQLVTKEELLTAVWPDTFVGDANLKVTIRHLRAVLADDPKSPRFIETAHRRGYRFIGQIAGDEGQVRLKEPLVQSESVSLRPSPSGVYCPPGVVGRDEALTEMQGWLDRMLGGQRQVVFVTGEPGIGKTTLIDAFAESLAADRTIRVARGQCLEQYGTGEAYLPVLEAIGRLCRQQAEVADLLRAQAPMWLLQMPALLNASDRESLGRDLAGATRERMLREMGEALESLTAEQPLVLILEDLHWSDYSTLDLISYLARQRQPAHLMVIGTYRMVELIVSGHPLKAVKQELLAKQQCEELPLEYLTEGAIAAYLAARFPDNRFPAKLAALIYQRTEGNPLFMVNAVDYLAAERLVVQSDDGWELVVEIERVEVGVPESIRQMIEKQMDHLDAEDQRTLEAASVAGSEFSSPAVVAGLGEDRAAVEARCEGLARRRQFIRDCGVQELPTGETVTRYGFIHALYQNVLYERLPKSRRVQLHRRIAERGEELYGPRASEIAAELAMHFERGLDYERAAAYLNQASENAVQRFAYREAVGLARRGLELLERLPETPGRDQQELSLQLTLGVPLMATEGYASPDVGNAYSRARQLCRRLGERPELPQALWGLWTFHLLRADVQTSREIAGEFLRLAENPSYPRLGIRAHLAMGCSLVHLGEFSLAREHLRKGQLLRDREEDSDDGFRYTQDLQVGLGCHGAWALWFLGQPDQALAPMQTALDRARALSEPHGVAHTFLFAAFLHHLRREASIAYDYAEASVAVAREHGLAMYEAHSTIIRAWALIQLGRPEGAIEEIRRGLAAQKATGGAICRTYFMALLAEALGKNGQTEEGLRVLEDELAHAYGERSYLPEIYRIKGELLLLETAEGVVSGTDTGRNVGDAIEPVAVQAESCFDQAITIARQQGARSWELRAVTSLARVYCGQNRRDEARDLIAKTYNQFTEGFATADLQEARALLQELSEPRVD